MRCRQFVLNVSELIRVVLGCLHVLFVQQVCVKGNCRYNDNFLDVTSYNAFVIFFNFFTLSMFLLLYITQYRRDRYLSRYLDISLTYYTESLNTFLRANTSISRDIYDYNSKLFNVVRWLIVTYVCNTILSAVVIIYLYSDGVKTITTLFTNVLLIAHRLYDLYDVSWRTLHTEQRTLSTTIINFAPYNDVKMLYGNRM
jgi:hypothetical protein